MKALIYSISYFISYIVLFIQKLNKSTIQTDQGPVDTDIVFKTSSGRLKKVTTSYAQTRRLRNVWHKTSDLLRIENV